MLNNCLKVAALTISMGMGSLAIAAENAGSEYLHQAPAGKIEVTPKLGIGSSETSIRNSTNKSKVSSTPLTVLGEYGINDMFSTSLLLGYSTSTTTITNSPSTKAKGMNDPVLAFNAKMPVGPGALRTGADLSIAIEKKKIETSGDSNSATGGIALTPYVGYEMDMGTCKFGARLAIDLYKSDRKQSNANGSETTTSGGGMLTLAPFFEHTFTPMITLGGALSYSSTAETSSKTGTATASTSGKNANTNIGVKVYVPLTVAENITVLPELVYNSTSYSDSNSSLTSGTGYTVNVGARFTF